MPDHSTDQPAQHSTVSDGPERWSLIIPYFNEEDFIDRTLASVAAQTVRPIELILVNNASTDASPAIVRRFAEAHADLDVIMLDEPRPGQARALETGIAAATGTLTAICDADTIYPPAYLETAQTLFARGGPAMAAVIAFGVGDPESREADFARLKGALVGRLLARQCHGGGYAHAFRTDILKSVGGYSQALWPYCLKDHELMHRVSKVGRLGYSRDHWCIASDRRSSRANIRWTLGERLIYHATPHAFKDWFFYDFLKARFEARGLSELKLRERDWEEAS